MIPHDKEIEKQVLGAILIDGNMMSKAKGLTPEDFFIKDHQRIIKECLDLYERGEKIECFSVGSRLNGLGKYVSDLAADTPTTANLDLHMSILRDISIKRYIYISFIREFDRLTHEEIASKIKDISQRLDFPKESGRGKALSDEVRAWIESSKGVFNSSEVVVSLHLSSREEKKNLSKILTRLCTEKNNIIERTGHKNGMFRILDRSMEKIDWHKATGEPLPIRWPFEIERFVHTMPKNIIVVAGTPDSGKTAFLLNTVYLNYDCPLKIRYLSSEMGDSELKSRVNYFDHPEYFDNIEFFEKSSAFADAVLPEGINIIDFMESHGEDSKYVTEWIKQIFDKLTTGIAIIALQKKIGQTWAKGGEYTKEKARLYITLDPLKEGNMIRLEKAKNWVDSMRNPNKLQKEYKLVKGCQYFPLTDWHKEGEI